MALSVSSSSVRLVLAVALLAALRTFPACSSDASVPASKAPDGGAAPTPAGPTARGDVLTARNNNGRTGGNRDEVVLDTSNANKLALRGSYAVDGDLTTQPLVASGVPTPGGVKNLVFVATMNNTVYAFDADTLGGPPVWRRGADVFGPAPSLYAYLSQIGIMSTPVVDRERGVIDVVSRTCVPGAPMDAPACAFHLVALALGTGDVVRSTTIAGASASVTFDPAAQWNRPGLLLQSGRIVVAFGAGPRMHQHEEDFVYHGWIFSYDASDLAAAPLVYCTTPQSRGGGIWQSGTGVAGDEKALYFATGNRVLANEVKPPAEYPASPLDHEDSVVQLPLAQPTYVPGMPGPLTYWDQRPYRGTGNVFQFMESNDIDFGASAPMLLPDSNRVVVGSKSGTVYVLDRGTMKDVVAPLGPFTQQPLASGETLYVYSWATVPVIFGALVHFRPDRAEAPGNPADTDRLYAWPNSDLLKSLSFDRSTDELGVVAVAPAPALGGILAVSSNGGAVGSAIVWALTASPTSATAGHLWAFDAMNLRTLFDIDTPARAKFAPPTVARGRVYVATSENQVMIYGLP